jgi:hypothetical protein
MVALQYILSGRLYHTVETGDAWRTDRALSPSASFAYALLPDLSFTSSSTANRMHPAPKALQMGT